MMEDKFGLLWTAILANVIGGLVFFYPDLHIFKEKPTWVVIHRDTHRVIQKFKSVKLAKAFVEENKYYLASKGIPIVYTRSDV